MKPEVSFPKSGSRIVFRMVKVFIFGVCSFLFLLLMDDVWKKYSSRITTTGVSYSVRWTKTAGYKVAIL